MSRCQALGAFFCGVSTGAKRLMLSIGGLLGGAAAHAALSEDTMVGAENSAAASREGRRASTSVEGVKYTRKLQVVNMDLYPFYINGGLCLTVFLCLTRLPN